ncbi:hypothetical protein L4D76_24930 [Photobacterium sagamiensis]|uniref:hypothetical protein n=1 Tax=Photobacterium sagamiensis TaxID=2910241 RepID=UPI003D0B27E6
MSKLLKLKKYFTIADAARYLSNSLDEPVSVADIYELALDNKLTVSVRLIDQAYAIGGQYVSSQDNDTNQYQVDFNLATNEALDKPYIICLDDELQIEKNKWLVLDKQVRVIDGIWDLAMIGIESQKIKEFYQKQVGGPEPVFRGVNGFFLKQGELIYKLQNSLLLMANDENRTALQARLDGLLKSNGLTINDIVNSGNSDALDCLNDAELEEIMQLSFAFMQNETGDHEENGDYLPLEDHSYQFVIRTDELTRFVLSLQDEPTAPPQPDKPLAVRERNTLLALIGALCNEARIDLSIRGISTSLQEITERAGVPISNETIRKIVEQVDDAMERRRK